MRTKTVYCLMPAFCCGVIVAETNMVIDAAPKLRAFVGQHFTRLRAWLLARGGSYQILP